MIIMEIKVTGLNEKVLGFLNLASGGSVSTTVGHKMAVLLSKFGEDVLGQIKRNSPVGKISGGSYRSAWNVVSGPAGAGVFASIIFTNQLPYAINMEEGSKPGDKPWPSKGPRTVLRDGRIWSSQYPEPVAGSAIDDADFEELRQGVNSIIREII